MNVEWSVFKAFVDLRSLSIQWIDNGHGFYILSASDDGITLSCDLYQSNLNADLSDFELNYKPYGNKSTNTSFFNTSQTSVLKTTAGKLLSVIYSRTGGLGNTTWTLYDNTAASGTIIHQCTLGGNAASTILDFDSRFNNGLTIVTGSASHNITVIWK